MSWMKRVMIALDQLVNAMTGGWPDETLSSRCWRMERDNIRSWPRKLVDGLLFFDENHCRESYNSEQEGRQLPPEFRKQPKEAGNAP